MPITVDEYADALAGLELHRLAILCHARQLRRRLEVKFGRRGKEIENLTKALRSRRREVEALWRRIKERDEQARDLEQAVAVLERALIDVRMCESDECPMCVSCNERTFVAFRDPAVRRVLGEGGKMQEEVGDGA